MRRDPLASARRIKPFAAGFALTALAACGGGDACGMEAMADTTGWRVVDAGYFVFKLPPGYRDEVPIGSDSYVGEWTRGGRSVRFSWGPHTGDPRDEPQRPGDLPMCEARVGGRTAVLREARYTAPDSSARFEAGGWWDRPDTLTAPFYLAAGAPADDTAGQRVARTIVRTVRLRTVWSAEDNLRHRHRLCEMIRVYEARLRAQYPDGPTPAVPPDAQRLCPTGPPPPPPDYESVR